MADSRSSVDQFNQWFMKFAPKAYRDIRKKSIESVEQGLALGNPENAVESRWQCRALFYSEASETENVKQVFDGDVSNLGGSLRSGHGTTCPSF